MYLNKVHGEPPLKKKDAETRYHKPVILHCAFCVIMTRFQLTFLANCITMIIITLINIIIIITILTLNNIIITITHISIITIVTHITVITRV